MTIYKGRLLGLAGKMHSGKSTVGSILQNTGVWTPLKFAKDLKAITKAIIMAYGVPGELSEDCVNGNLKEVPLVPFSANAAPFTARRFMQLIGTEYIRSLEYADFWLNSSRFEAARLMESGKNIYYDDLRFRDTEGKFISQNGSSLYIMRPEEDIRASMDVERLPLEKIEKLNAMTPNRFFVNNIFEESCNIFDRYWIEKTSSLDMSLEAFFSLVLGANQDETIVKYEELRNHFGQFMLAFRHYYIAPAYTSGPVHDIYAPLPKTQTSLGHSSENLYGPEDADVVISNDGTLEELRDAVTVFLTEMDMGIITQRKEELFKMTR